jgi:hypothetical protein
MLVLAPVKNMNIRVIEEIATPISMASLIFYLRTLSLSVLIFAIRSHPLSLMLAEGHAYILFILIPVWGRMPFRSHGCTCTTAAMFFMQHSPRPH